MTEENELDGAQKNLSRVTSLVDEIQTSRISHYEKINELHTAAKNQLSKEALCLLTNPDPFDIVSEKGLKILLKIKSDLEEAIREEKSILLIKMEELQIKLTKLEHYTHALQEYIQE